MEQNQALIDHLVKRVSLNEDEIQEFISYFKITKVKKRQFIIQPDFIPKYRNYVLKGAFRAYIVVDQGEEHTIQFAVEDWWISDYNGYIYQRPATMFVMAIEDSLILQLDFESEQQLKASNHKFETFFRIMAERSFAGMQRRLISNLTKTAEERYQEFEENYPLIANRVPQYALASFLGMTTQYLSKLRNMRVTSKS
ncbi:cAMP-binding domain of CRP or a regulatory subunit of cAMP-dependent protein kinases [Flagellimonas taeanensis]|jgi:CRP-like cAMP-binding protein|uniref:cAMP-binding domain of CRP or a regulatory subunit of cAMP-dependent protein kinases n=1 Tax=Flagellimonas taeanensis TaxID=1005926 RepID=A0A1M6WCZ6_9FLAO|nr:Crp/Fnr family transcriptional regulator [Allomuricauda taeanensis]SFC44420.1 cAMP-binding domain of CRP or a regulatory subunit of cAMP-dependent protein kinases [Allomuricauda taeanensis]SHK91456.1 cAMP-binding domain of CRP or a regulatory subunit of cAMP-dependent protein kinases [Allomuricauda taeanensis]